jgi:hypothetical protein
LLFIISNEVIYDDVIVANQNGNDCINDDNLKFQYVNGVLENTKTENNSTMSILESQGIREHVCEILEGGKEFGRKKIKISKDKLKINQYKTSFDGIARYIENEQKEQVEIWFARELQTVLGYVRLENFLVAINRAVELCKTQCINVYNHFRKVTKMVELGSGLRQTQLPIPAY